jgi:putative transposase
VNNDRVKLSKIGSIKAILHRPITGKIKTCTVCRQNNKAFIYLTTVAG